MGYLLLPTDAADATENHVESILSEADFVFSRFVTGSAPYLPSCQRTSSHNQALRSQRHENCVGSDTTKQEDRGLGAYRHLLVRKLPRTPPRNPNHFEGKIFPVDVHSLGKDNTGTHQRAIREQ